MPAPKFLPVAPRMTTTPPVMYSQACFPTPSATAVAPELRMAKRSPAVPAANKFPSREPLADVVVGHALQGQGHALSGKGAEGLSCRTAQVQADVRLQFGLPATQQCQLARHPRAKAAIFVLHYRVVQ